MIRHELGPPGPHEEGGLMSNIMKSAMITTVIAFSMYLSGFPANIIPPTIAPIWMGFAMLLSKR